MRFYFIYIAILVGSLLVHTHVIYASSNLQKNKIYYNENNNEINDSIPKFILQLQKKLNSSDNIFESAFYYLSMAINHLEYGDYNKALDASLIAYYLALTEDETQLKANALLIIAQINVFWDNPKIGFEIYNKVDELILKSNIEVDLKFKLLILLGKSSAVLKMGNPDEAFNYINEAFEYDISKLEGSTYSEFVFNLGIVYFQKGAYQRAFDSLEKATKNSSSIYFEMLTKYYRAQEKIKNGNPDEAVLFYLVIDSILSQNNMIFPERKEIYEYINDYYKIKGDRISQFFFLNKFLKELNTYSETTVYISKTTNEFYEIPKLIREKQIEIEKLKITRNQNLQFILVISILLIVLVVLLFFQFRKNKIYKKRFDNLMSNSHQVKSNDIETNSQELSVEVISDILQKLDEFEKNKVFLDRNSSLHDIAKQFNTNSTYLSKVVNIKKDKNFSNYINQLRIEYCLEVLKKDKKILNYTIKAIAEEVGFNNAQSFSNAFYKFTGIYPSYFVEQLKKDKNK